MDSCLRRNDISQLKFSVLSVPSVANLVQVKT